MRVARHTHIEPHQQTIPTSRHTAAAAGGSSGGKVAAAQKLDLDIERRPRMPAEMAEEAATLRQLFT